MTRLPSHIKDEPHIRLWANFFDDPDVEALHPMAQLLYLRMACRIRQMRTDGWIHDAHVAKLGMPSWRKHVDTLVHTGMLTEYRDHNGRPKWHMTAYPKWNWSEEDYARSKHNGRIGGCLSKHPQPCQAVACAESRAWLDSHPQMKPPVQPPLEVPL